MRLFLAVCLLAGMLSLPWSADSQPVLQPSKELRQRRPIALLLDDSGNQLLVANRDSGTIAVVDTATGKVTAETRLARKLSDMAVLPKGTLPAGVLATDEDAGELVWVTLDEGTPKEHRRLAVGMTPVSVRVLDDRWAAVSLLWPRRLVLVDLARDNTAAPFTLDLPFAPRRLCAVPGTAKVIVTDAFAGKLVVVDARQQKIESVRSLAVQNIRGLALDRGSKHLLLTHQVLHAQGHTTAGDIRTGNLITNNLRRFALAAVLDPAADILRSDQSYSLGDVELGAGDPTDVAETTDGQMVVAFAGVHEVALGRPEQGLWTRLAVGRRPTALALDATRRLAYVANTFSDSISVLDLQRQKVSAEIALGKSPELRPEERGEMLFHDARLSFESWFSCQSCHTDGHTSGRLNDNLSDGSFGTPKRVLSLLGVKDTGPWAWNGKMPDLETQIRSSLKSTMQGPKPREDQVSDLAAFLRTLAPPPSLLKARGMIDEDSFKRGRKIFSQEKCASCHSPTQAYTTPKSYDVGLRDEVGGTHFNPPSLRGVSQGGPYFHDNRAHTLEEVFGRFRHQLSRPLTKDELGDLLHFLSGL